jgi:uncharacterized protein (TIGR02145 family)
MKARNAGLLYSARAADYIQANIDSLVGSGWRVPEITDFTNLKNALPDADDLKAANLSYAPGWNGNDSSGLGFVPTGFHNVSAFYNYPSSAFMWLNGWSGSYKYSYSFSSSNTYSTGSGTLAFSYAIRLIRDE